MSRSNFVLALVACCAAAALSQECTNSRIDLVFLVDGSGSICDQDQDGLVDDNDNPGSKTCANWNSVKSFMARFVENLGTIGSEGNHVGLATFANEGKLIFDLSEYTDVESLAQQLRTLPYPGGKTATAHGFEIATQDIFTKDGDRSDARNVLVIITDGIPNVPEQNPVIEAKAAADNAKRGDSDLAIFTLGVTKSIDEDLLRHMSSHSQELNRNYFTSADFAELENIRQQVITETCRTTPKPADSCSDTVIDLAFLVDGSGSICGNCGGCGTCDNYESVKNFLIGVIDNLDVGPNAARIAVVIYSEKSEILFNFNTYDAPGPMEAAIQSMRFPDSRTNTTGGIRTLRHHIFTSENGDRPEARNVVVVLTDGNPTVENEATSEEAQRFRERSNVEVIVLGITENVQHEVLRYISSPPQLENQNWFTVQDFTALFSVIQDIAETACQTPAPVITTPSPRSCTWAVDIIFILDSSGSIGYDNFEFMKAFVADLTDKFDIGASTRVGVVRFSDNAEIMFDLGAHDTFDSVRKAILEIPYNPGTTNTADAINRAKSIFDGDSARPDSAKVAVIMTDGGSNNKQATYAAAHGARKSMEIVTMGLGDWIDEFELKAISSDSYTSNLIMVDKFTELPNFVDSMKAMLCNDVNECSDNPCGSGQCVDMMNQYYCICNGQRGGRRCDYTCRTTPEVAFVLDSSGSIGKENFQLIVDFVKEVALQLPLDNGANIGLETFSDDVKVYLTVDGDQGVLNVMESMTIPYFVGGQTRTGAALRTMTNQVFANDNSQTPNWAILLTDGRSQNAEDTWRAAMEARAAGISILAIGVGNSVRDSELRGIASYPSSANVIEVAEYTDLTDRIPQIRDILCSAENECSSSPCQNGGECHDVTGGFYCTCPEPWTGRLCQKSCGSGGIGNSKLDLAVLLDVSGSIRREKFEEVKQHIANIIGEYEIYDGKVRVGLVSFSSTASTEFYFNTYNNKQDIQEAIMRVGYVGARTNIAHGFEKLREEIFVPANGDRVDVENVVLLFTDGGANIREDETIPEAIKLRLAGKRIITMSVGQQIDVMEMMAVASSPTASHMIRANSFDGMNNMMSTFVDATCNSVDDCSSNPCRNGGSCVDGYGTYTCVCPSDRTGENCERECRASYDVAFVLDLSGSLYDVYALGKTLIEKVIQGLEFRLDRTRAAFVLFSDRATVRFQFNTYTMKSEMIEALSIKDIGGRTNTQSAFQVLRDEVFKTENGARSNAADKIVLVTDGASNMRSDETIPKAQALRDNGIEIYVVAVGDQVNMDEVNSMAHADSNNYVYRVYNSGDVDAQASLLLNELC